MICDSFQCDIVAVIVFMVLVFNVMMACTKWGLRGVGTTSGATSISGDTYRLSLDINLARPPQFFAFHLAEFG